MSLLRRPQDGAAYLCNRVLPDVPLRQWVLSLPKVLRYLLAYDGELCRAVAASALWEIFHFQRMQARHVLGLRRTRCAYPGAMVAVQRFGSALNLNIHFHALVLDGVYILDAFGEPEFRELPQPKLAELHELAGRSAQAILDLLRRRRIWVDDLEEGEDSVDSGLAPLARASIHGHLLMGRAGERPVRLRDGRVREEGIPDRAGKALGFVLDAEVRVSAHNRLHRERLCRYLLRPPLAKGRLHETLDGKYAFELKTPWSDGTRVVFFSGEELVARLTALVPPPRMHLVHYYGVLAPNAKLRSKVVPQVDDNDAEHQLCGGAVCYEETKTSKTIRRRWVPWATLLLRVFAIDVFDCPSCHGRLQRIAWITQVRVIKAILDCVNEKPLPP
jgi:hypothetical protein